MTSTRSFLAAVLLAPACLGDAGDAEVGRAAGALAEVTWTAAVGVTATGNDLVKSASEATWGAGAASVETLSGDGYVEFTTGESTTAKMAGLSNGNSDPTYQDIDFALYLGANGTVSVREGGQPRGSFGAYVAGDVFRVQVLGGVVTYWRNDAILYTSAATPTFPLLVDTSLRTPGATISDAVIEQEMFWTGRVNATADGNDLVKTAPDPTWNAGAISATALSGDGHVEFTTGENTTAKMAGLSNGDGGTGFEDIDFAIFLGANGVVGVREGGLTRGTFGPYAAGDLFRVAVSGSVVTYARNGTVFYTSGAAPTFPLLLDTSLRTPGATILDASVIEAPAGMVVFDNSDGTFVWDWDCGCVTEPPNPPAWLNPSRAADQQSGLASARSILFFKQDPSVGMSTPGEFAFQGREAPGGLAIAAAPSFIIPGNEEGYDRSVIPPLSKSPGDVVGPTDDWRQRVLTAHFTDLSGSYGPSQTWFQDGIIGVRFPMADGVHYGFIELDYVPNDFNSWYAVYRPVRWGYNPVPNQPLVVPPPAVIVFDNSDATFVWEPYCHGCVEQLAGVYLDVNLPADQQSGGPVPLDEPAPTSIVLSVVEPWIGNITAGAYVFRGDRTDSALEVARGDRVVVLGSTEETSFTAYPPLAKSAGDVVGPADHSWGPARAAHLQDLSGEYGPTQIWFRDGIIGVRFQRDDGLHYGFIELDQVGVEESYDYRPIRWGYATAPDTPLVIPP